jgi:hypothetical protein
MAIKTNTFAGQLLHFAQSVDIVDDSTFTTVRDLVYRYMQNELGAQYFELMREQFSVDDDVRTTHLKTFWSSTETFHFWDVCRRGGGYTNVISMAFDRDKPVGIVSRTKVPLEKAADCEDRWSHLDGPLPPCRPAATGQSVHTVIAVPIHYRRKLGIYYFETREYIDLSEVAKNELRLLADALGILLELWYINQSQSDCTRGALGELGELLSLARFPRLARPHFFVGFSNRADPAVVAVIQTLLEGFADQLEFTDWSTIQESGNIATQINREIGRSRFGICYLSEPSAYDTGHVYQDNPNVIFEAGMLHRRTTLNESTSTINAPAGWIPIRESDSPAPPFDFAHERIVYVPRNRDGEVLEAKLRDQLSRRIRQLLSTGASS